jgi:hypothetical protein
VGGAAAALIAEKCAPHWNGFVWVCSFCSRRIDVKDIKMGS